MKNRFFVFIEIIIGLIFMLLVGIGAFIPFAVSEFGEDVFLTVILTIMLVVLPSVLFVLGIWIFASQIRLDETGMSKYFFGIKLKYYKWEEIDDIKIYGNRYYVQSISFYKKRREKSLFQKWIKYERIFFTCNEKKLLIFDNYAPENIKEQIKYKQERLRY